MSAQVVTRNKVVLLTYTVRDAADGAVLEVHEMPIGYVHGCGAEMFPKLAQALEGKGVGERITVTLSPEEGFGPRDPGLTFTDDLDNVPPELRAVGREFEAANASGETRTFVVTAIADGKLTVDANHPFAGKTVRFEIRIEDIRDATAEEIRAGYPQAGPVTLQ
jgi:FKBP-type peptidyl-prolyl cis-trans isomerase SlyD